MYWPIFPSKTGPKRLHNTKRSASKACNAIVWIHREVMQQWQPYDLGHGLICGLYGSFAFSGYYADFGQCSESKRTPKDCTAPKDQLPRNVMSFFGSTEKWCNSDNHVIWVMGWSVVYMEVLHFLDMLILANVLNLNGPQRLHRTNRSASKACNDIVWIHTREVMQQWQPCDLGHGLICGLYGSFAFSDGYADFGQCSESKRTPKTAQHQKISFQCM